MGQLLGNEVIRNTKEPPLLQEILRMCQQGLEPPSCNLHDTMLLRSQDKPVQFADC